MTETTSPHFLVEPNNPNTFTFAELDELAVALRESDPAYDARVAFSGEQIGAGLEWLEIVNVWISQEYISVYVQSGRAEEDARRVAVAVVSNVVVNWLINRKEKRATPPPDNPDMPEEDLSRPTRIGHILDHNGRILDSVRIRYPYHEVEHPEIETPASYTRNQPPTYDKKQWPPKPPFNRRS